MLEAHHYGVFGRFSWLLPMLGYRISRDSLPFGLIIS